MKDSDNPTLFVKNVERWRAAAIGALGIALVCFTVTFLLSKAQPFVTAITLAGLLFLPKVVMDPRWGLLAFLWLAHTIDGVKRLIYAVSNFSQTDIASILIVPVLVAGALYLKIFVLKWFGDRGGPPVRLFKFWPILLALFGAIGFLLRGGFEFETLVSNYAFVCYIPAAIAVPYILYNTERRMSYVRTLITIAILVGAYGLIQAVHGPFDFERTYVLSGLTQTIGSIEGQLYFRAFSLLNNGPTFCGVMVMINILSYFYFCRKHGRLRPTLGAVLMTIFTVATCFAATQRAPIICLGITLLLLPLFTRPRAFIIAICLGLACFAGVIRYSEELLEKLYIANDTMATVGDNPFVQQNVNLLTYAQRLNGFSDLSNPALWTPFGTARQIGKSDIMANDIAYGHDLISNFLEWFGYVGTGAFLLMTLALLLVVVMRAKRLMKNPERALWAQCNLGVFLFMMIWQLLTGPAMSVSPLQFYFWVAVGNLNYLLSESDPAPAVSSRSSGAPVRPRLVPQRAALP